MGIAAYMIEQGCTDAELAARIGVDRSLVRRWRLGLKPVGAKRVLVVEKVTGVDRHELRPDLYPEPAPRKRRPSPVNGG
jgi:DNA-binding transcriptional regulator YdaS (Cro superfamily)